MTGSPPAGPRAEALRMATIRVNRSTCCGNGMCFAVAPGSFDLGDDGIVVVLEPAVTAESRPAVEHAMAVCPTASISIEETSV
jgi:ferredoxin